MCVHPHILAALGLGSTVHVAGSLKAGGHRERPQSALKLRPPHAPDVTVSENLSHCLGGGGPSKGILGLLQKGP